MILKMDSRITVASVSIEDLPIPAAKGGAIEIIVEKLVKLTSARLDWKVFSSGGMLKPNQIKQFEKTGQFLYFKMSRGQRLAYAVRHLIPEWRVYSHWIARQIVKEQVDVVVLHNELKYLPDLRWAKSQNPNLKIIMYFHNDYAKDFKKQFQQVDFVIGVSEYILKQFIKAVPQYPKSQMACIHNASHLPVAGKKKSGRKPTILFVGRLTRYKGAYLLLEAAKYLDFRIVFVGTSHHGKKFIEPEFLKLKDSLPRDVQKRISLAGFVTPAQTMKCYDQADLLVFPSLWQEPSGLVLFEAWARGLPVLATRVGGIPELVGKYKHAQLVSPQISPEVLAGEIENLMKNKNRLKILSGKGKQFIQTHGNFERLAQEFEEIISSQR